jgi:hypothetical protein
MHPCPITRPPVPVTVTHKRHGQGEVGNQRRLATRLGSRGRAAGTKLSRGGVLAQQDVQIGAGAGFFQGTAQASVAQSMGAGGEALVDGEHVGGEQPVSGQGGSAGVFLPAAHPRILLCFLRRRAAASGSTASTARVTAARSCPVVCSSAAGRICISTWRACSSVKMRVASAISRALARSMAPPRRARAVPGSRMARSRARSWQVPAARPRSAHRHPAHPARRRGSRPQPARPAAHPARTCPALRRTQTRCPSRSKTPGCEAGTPPPGFHACQPQRGRAGRRRSGRARRPLSARCSADRLGDRDSLGVAAVSPPRETCPARGDRGRGRSGHPGPRGRAGTWPGPAGRPPRPGPAGGFAG